MRALGVVMHCTIVESEMMRLVIFGLNGIQLKL